ncbi:MAG: hypothetical protein M0026_06990 [Nocardiopsaceae bacterium]|nr:hypothetical protein [Nocardiopsaceae bacterium]
MDIGQGLAGAWAAVASFVPKLAAFLIILILGWIIAKFVGRLVGKALARVGLDRGLNRSGIGEYFQRSKYSASQLSGKVVYYIGLLIVLQLAFSVFGPQNPITQLINSIIAWIPQAIVALVIVVVTGIIAKAARDIVSGALGGLSYGRFLANLVGVFIMALGVIAALNQMGVATAVTQPILITVLATIGGILVVGVGGGMIRPMQQRWANWLNVAEQETAKIREDNGYQAGRSDAMRPSAPQQATAGRGGAHSAQSSRPGTAAGGAEHRGRPG